MKSHVHKTFATLSLVTLAAIPSLSFAQTTTPETTSISRKTLNVACAQNAVDARDTAIITALGNFSSSMTTALTTRKDALKLAYSLTTKAERTTAQKAAWSTYKASSNTAHSALKTARKAAWSTFESTRKTCKDTESSIGSEKIGTDATMNL